MLADRVAARRDAVRSDPVSIEEFGYLLGGQGANRSKSGVSVGADRAMRTTSSRSTAFATRVASRSSAAAASSRSARPGRWSARPPDSA